MRGASHPYKVLRTFDTTDIAANNPITYTMEKDKVEPGKRVRRIFFRWNTDVILGSSTAKINLASEVARKSLFDGMISRIQVNMPSAGADRPLKVEQMSFGELMYLHSKLGVYPTCPQLFGDGQFAGPVSPLKRTAVTDASGTQSHFCEFELPILDLDLPGFGGSLLIGSEQLENMTLQITFGALTASDDASVGITIPNGTGGTAGVSSVELCVDYEDLAPGVKVVGNVPIYRKLDNGTTTTIMLNPEGGAILCANVRFSALSDDSLGNILRTYVFSSAQDLGQAQLANWNPLIEVDGKSARDLPFRGFTTYCNLDQINAGIGPRATANALRATNASATTAAGKTRQAINDPGLDLIWPGGSDPSQNALNAISVGRHNITWPNAWNASAFGQRTIFLVELTPAGMKGVDPPKADQRLVPPQVNTIKESTFGNLLRFLGFRR